jgi:hypothetical protein
LIIYPNTDVEYYKDSRLQRFKGARVVLRVEVKSF